MLSPSHSSVEAVMHCIDNGLRVHPVVCQDMCTCVGECTGKSYLCRKNRKAPLLKDPTAFRERSATPHDAREWIHNFGEFALGVYGGKASGNLEIIDIEEKDLLAELRDQMECFASEADIDWEQLYRKLVIVKTPGPGWHLYYRCEEISGNTVLAQCGAESGRGKNGLLIETRGEGGYAVSPLSPATTHEKYKTEGAYEFRQGDFSTIPTLTKQERNFVLFCCRSLSEIIPKEHIVRDTTKGITGTRPGDYYNKEVDWSEILHGLGWTIVRERGEVTYWKQPNKTNKGHSASTNFGNLDLLYVFSSNCPPFDGMKGYTKFTAFAKIKHGGDFSLAASDLAKQGYGASARLDRKKELIEQQQALAPGESVEDIFIDDMFNTDLNNGRKFVRDHSNFVKHSKELGWMVYENGVYKVNAYAAARELAKLTAKNVYKSISELPAEQRIDVLKTAKALHGCKGLKGMLEMAETEPEILTQASLFDAPDTLYLFNCANKIIDLQTGQAMPHDAKYRITKQAPVKYDPHAECPNYDRFLLEVFDGDQELIKFWLRWMAYSLTGTTREEKMVFLEGPGGNGKSVSRNAFLSVVQNPISGISYVRTLPKSALMVTHSDQTANITRTYGARAVVVSEVNQADKIDEGTFKDFVTGEEQSAKILYKDGFDFKPKAKLWMHGNHLPKIVGTDEGIWRRILRVPFTQSFVGDGKQPKLDLDDIFREEASGIFNLILNNMDDWMTGGLQPPSIVLKATDEYRTEQNAVKVFLKEACEIGSDYAIRSRSLYQFYQQWCDATGRLAKSEPNFAEEMKRLKINKDRKNLGYFYQGLRMANQLNTDHTHTPHGDD